MSALYYLSVAFSACLFQVESLVLTAAAEGRWEAIQQAFHLPGQRAVVQEARNKVTCNWAEQLVSSSSLPLYHVLWIFCLLLSTAVWMDLPSLCCLQWTPPSCQEAHQSLWNESRPAEQGTGGLFACLLEDTCAACVCAGSTICQGINKCENYRMLVWGANVRRWVFTFEHTT